MALVFLFSFIAVLGSIVYQDFKNRSVDIFSLGLFILLSLAFSIIQNTFVGTLKMASLPLIFIGFQILILTLFFSIKEKKIVSIIDTKLGLGDIVFWLGLAFHFSLIHFIVFFVFSLTFTLIISVAKKLETIPLAGGQGIFLILFLISNTFFLKINTFDDLHFINLLF